MRQLLSKYWYLALTFSLFVGSIALIWIYGSWQVALGVFLFVWGNNMDSKIK
jgi:hypothetical protein